MAASAEPVQQVDLLEPGREGAYVGEDVVDDAFSPPLGTGTGGRVEGHENVRRIIEAVSGVSAAYTSHSGRSSHRKWSTDLGLSRRVLDVIWYMS